MLSLLFPCLPSVPPGVISWHVPRGWDQMLTFNHGSGTWMEPCFFCIRATALNLSGTKVSQNQDLVSLILTSVPKPHLHPTWLLIRVYLPYYCNSVEFWEMNFSEYSGIDAIKNLNLTCMSASLSLWPLPTTRPVPWCMGSHQWKYQVSRLWFFHIFLLPHAHRKLI